MRQILTALTVLAALPAIAQDTPAPAAPAEEPAADAAGLSMGQPVSPDGGELGSPYVKEAHGDWQIRCIRTESGKDPCQLYQLLVDVDGNSVAEFALFPLIPPQGDAIAGGTVITPLETLLTQQVTLAVNGGEARRYPFTFCNEVGCFARLGFAAADLDRFKKGATATVAIVPVVAPDQMIRLTVSLTGFTAGYDALDAMMKELAAAGQ